MSAQNILTSIYTTHQAAVLQGGLSNVINALYSLKTDPKKAIDKNLPQEFSEDLLEAFKKQGISLKDPQAVQKYLHELKEYLDQLPKITLILAFDPTVEFLKKLSNRIKNLSGGNHLIDKVFDPNVVGGTQIVFNNLYKDYSLKKKIENYNYFSAKRQASSVKRQA